MQFLQSVKFREITYGPLLLSTFSGHHTSFWLEFAEELNSAGDVHAELHIDNDHSNSAMSHANRQRVHYFIVSKKAQINVID